MNSLRFITNVLTTFTALRSDKGVELITCMEYERLPSYTEWSESYDFSDMHKNGLYYPVRRILVPNRYPSWTFITDIFRYSVRLPEEFTTTLKSYSVRKQDADIADITLLRLGVLVTEENARLTASTSNNDSLTQEQIDSDEWGMLIFCGKWYVIEYGEQQGGFVNSVPYDDSFKSVFMPDKGVLETSSKPARKPKKAH